MIKKDKIKSNIEFINSIVAVFFGTIILFFGAISIDIATGGKRFSDASLGGYTDINQLVEQYWYLLLFSFLILGGEPILLWFLILIDKSDLKAKEKHPEKKATIDKWFLRHALGSAVIAFFIPDYLLIFILGSIIFETFERFSSTNTKLFNYRYEPVPNQVFDIIANSLGYIIGSYISFQLGHPLSLVK